MKEGGVIATAKHFPGHSASAVDAHYNIPVIEVDKETMYERDRYDDRDKERIKAEIKAYDTVVITSYFNRAKLGNKEYLEEVLGGLPGESSHCFQYPL